ncbi:T3SS (YopN, CesT) and YbjN peptide-binding chaperone 1 [Janibacter anophelis]|uniref:T3SS (YopN, CesT) and YbjN peptide-binding chaperone 1 n=1 Tax=Janibacter anophelis TaxID=319054 RepID=UPI003F816EE1
MTEINHDDRAAQAEEIHAAWKAFDRRLLSFVEAMRHEQDRLVLEIRGSDEVPRVDFRLRGDMLHATIGEDEYDECVVEREAIAHRAVMLLRNIALVPHPDLLTHRASGPCAAMSPVLGLAWTGGERPPLDFYIESDQEQLLDIIEETVGSVHDVERDEDGDLVIEHMGQRVFIRVLPDAPAIEIFARVAHDVRSRHRTAVEISILNRSNPWVWWQLWERNVIQTSTVESMPFAPHHLMTTLAVFLQAMATRDDLALRVGGEVA